MKALATFLETYRQLDRNSLSLLSTIYEDEVVFTDPLHTIHGLESLERYFAGLYENLEEISFDFGSGIVEERDVCIQWRMRFRHRRLAAGRLIEVDGVSVLRFSERGKVSHHRDYFDLGSMVYEHIPILGRFLRYLKEKISK